VINNPELIRQRCNSLLTALVGKDLVDPWWHGNNRAFDDRAPIEVFDQDPAAVYGYLMRFYEGSGS